MYCTNYPNWERRLQDSKGKGLESRSATRESFVLRLTDVFWEFSDGGACYLLRQRPGIDKRGRSYNFLQRSDCMFQGTLSWWAHLWTHRSMSRTRCSTRAQIVISFILIQFEAVRFNWTADWLEFGCHSIAHTPFLELVFSTLEVLATSNSTIFEAILGRVTPTGRIESKTRKCGLQAVWPNPRCRGEEWWVLISVCTRSVAG